VSLSTNKNRPYWPVTLLANIGNKRPCTFPCSQLPFGFISITTPSYSVKKGKAIDLHAIYAQKHMKLCMESETF